MLFKYYYGFLYLVRFCPLNDFGEISADDLWTLFSSTIEGLFDVEANLEIFEPKDYVTLLFSVSAAVFNGSTCRYIGHSTQSLVTV